MAKPVEKVNQHRQQRQRQTPKEQWLEKGHAAPVGDGTSAEDPRSKIQDPEKIQISMANEIAGAFNY